MTDSGRRYWVVSPDLATAAGFENEQGAEAAALAFGDGSHVVDTMGQPYHPAVSKVEDGALAYVGFGSFDARRGLDACLIEAVKKGYPPIAKAFLAKGADADAVDDDGSPAIIWAVAGGSVEVVALLVEAGVDVDRSDAGGMTALALAEARGRADVAAALAAVRRRRLSPEASGD